MTWEKKDENLTTEEETKVDEKEYEMDMSNKYLDVEKDQDSV